MRHITGWHAESDPGEATASTKRKELPGRAQGLEIQERGGASERRVWARVIASMGNGTNLISLDQLIQTEVIWLNELA